MKALKILVAALLALPVLAGPTSSPAAGPRQITTSNPFLNLPAPTDDPRWGQAFAAWDRRDDTDQALRAVALFEALARDQPGRLEPQLWLARSYYLMGIRGRGDSQLAYLKKGTAAADRALKIDPSSDAARCWRYCSMLFYYDFTEKDYAEMRAMGKKYENLRELPVPADDPIWAKAIGHWDLRLSRKETFIAIALFEELNRKYPGRLEPRLWLCRTYYWLHYIEPTDEAKAAALMTAVEWGKKAQQQEPRNPAANYFIAAGLGQYGLVTNFTNIVRYAPEITRRLMLVMEEDPQYLHGGVSQYFGLAMAKAGSVVSRMLGMVGYSEEMLVRSVSFDIHFEPRYLRNYYSMGEFYLSRGKRDEAKKMWETALAADPAALKNMEPENRVTQELIRRLMKKEFGK